MKEEIGHLRVPMLGSEKVPLIFKTLIDIRARSYLVKKLLIKTIIEEKKEVLIKQSQCFCASSDVASIFLPKWSSLSLSTQIV